MSEWQFELALSKESGEMFLLIDFNDAYTTAKNIFLLTFGASQEYKCT